MHRAYPGRPCLGGGRDWISPANPGAVSGDGHLHHETRPGLSSGAPYRATYDGQSRSGAVTRDPAGCQDGPVDVLSSRILLRPADVGRSLRFYRDVLGLAIYREFGSAANPGVVFFLGGGLLEISGRAPGPPGGTVRIWLQVRDVHAEHERLAAAGARILRGPVAEPWGLTEMWVEDPDGIRLMLVEVPADHPLRRDPRSSPPPT
jgi:predicted enzyme related to lactoylglutathione lyase